ncbi:MAG: hypothetical protein JWO67_523 [Streptosporangiaceae bacterium]|nr:hypothetical protein [Streptosporangiaceae bacterium]
MPESWDLKLRRAWQNYRELDERIFNVTSGYQRRDIRVASKRRRGQWEYTAHCDLTMDEMIPVVIGECLFNVRSALDHIAVANVPAPRKRQAQFPIITEDIEGPASPRTQKPLEDWNRWTAEMTPPALAVVRAAQPYRHPHPENNSLAVLSAFQNADKHRELNIVVYGLGDARVELPDGVIDMEQATGVYGFLREGARVAMSPELIDVRVTGVPKLAMTRGRKEAHRELPVVLQDVLMEAQAVIEAIADAMQASGNSVPPVP